MYVTVCFSLCLIVCMCVCVCVYDVHIAHERPLSCRAMLQHYIQYLVS